MIANRQYFVVRIDKEQQRKKRELIVLGGAGYLGVRHSDGQDYKGPGIILTGTEVGSPAYAAGFKAKDIILSVNDVEINTFEQLVDEIAKYPPGTEVNLGYYNSVLLARSKQVKKVKLGQKRIDLENPAHLRDMRHNLQFGEILACGLLAHKNFPHAKKGDILLFHHSVEHKARLEGDMTFNDWHLIDHDEEGNEIRLVNYEFEVLGVLKIVKGKVSIIPHPKYVFCHQQIKKATVQQDAKSGLWLPDHWDKTILEYQAQLDELAAQIKEIQSSSVMKEELSNENYKQIGAIQQAIGMLMKEKRTIARKMHQKKLVEVTVLFFNEKSKETLGYSLSPGDKLIADYYSLYPLDIQGVCYSLARVGTIEAAALKKPLPFKKIKTKKTVMSNLFQPLRDRIIVKPHEAEVITESGLIIPDVAQQMPGRGEVVACGPGTVENPMEAMVGDIILYSKYAGTEVTYENQKYLFLREDEILTTLSKEEAAKTIAENNRVLARKLELEEQKKKQVEALASKKEEAPVPTNTAD